MVKPLFNYSIMADVTAMVAGVIATFFVADVNTTVADVIATRYICVG